MGYLHILNYCLVFFFVGHMAHWKENVFAFQVFPQVAPIDFNKVQYTSNAGKHFPPLFSPPIFFYINLIPIPQSPPLNVTGVFLRKTTNRNSKCHSILLKFRVCNWIRCLLSSICRYLQWSVYGGPVRLRRQRSQYLGRHLSGQPINKHGQQL